VPVVKGSVRSGDLGLREGEEWEVLGLGSEAENGWAERRRIAWVMVGWKRPPCGEYLVRCIGRVWPNEKNADVNLGPYQRS
jgi:hypothetical protein